MLLLLLIQALRHFDVHRKDQISATIGIIDGKRYKAVTNVGTRPSVDNDNRVTIETFFLELNEDLYGKEIILEFLGFIRPTQKFENISQLLLFHFRKCHQ